MILLGNTARELRESRGLNQKETAELLGISAVHLCNFENDKSAPSIDLIGKYRSQFGVDLYVLAWCLHGDVDSMPKGVRAATRKLADAWRTQLRLDRGQVVRNRKRGISHF